MRIQWKSPRIIVRGHTELLAPIFTSLMIVQCRFRYTLLAIKDCMPRWLQTVISSRFGFAREWEMRLICHCASTHFFGQGRVAKIGL